MPPPSLFAPSPAHPTRAGTSAPLPFWKRAIDLACCLAFLPLLALAAALIALWLRLTSPGPLLFTQPRIGQGGRTFFLYKFRTMRADADSTSHCAHFAQLVNGNRPMQKLDARDARVVPGGWFLRAAGLDELPQLLNILRGDMSMVGPRPCIPYEFQQYSPRQRARFDSVPGLTGLWQVSGKNRTTFEEMVRLDIEYSRRKSLWLDLAIIIKTPAVLLAQLVEARRSRRQPKPVAPAPTVRNPTPVTVQT